MIKWLRWKYRWLKWFLKVPGYRFGDPTLGTGETRKKNTKILHERHSKKEPRLDD